MHARWSVAAAALVFMTANCAGRDCTDIGEPSTVQIDTASVIHDRSERLTVRMCVNETCDTFDRFSRRLGWVDLDDPGIDVEGPVRVALTVSTDGGETIFDGVTTASLRLVQPNGPGCGDKFAVSLVASDGSSLRPSAPV